MCNDFQQKLSVCKQMCCNIQASLLWFVYITLFLARIPLSVTVLSDSMAKYVSDIPHTTVQVFRGANIARLVRKIDKKKASNSAKHTVILIGTNDVASSRPVQQIMSSFQDLITKIRTKSSTNLIILALFRGLVTCPMILKNQE